MRCKISQLGGRHRRWKAQERDSWKAVVREARAHRQGKTNCACTMKHWAVTFGD
jgi:hypothetical protein